jgi:hypothetical protein
MERPVYLPGTAQQKAENPKCEERVGSFSPILKKR